MILLERHIISSIFLSIVADVPVQRCLPGSASAAELQF